MKRRLLALLLSVMMILSLAPTAAFAEESEDPAQGGETIVEPHDEHEHHHEEEPAEDPAEQPAEEPAAEPAVETPTRGVTRYSQTTRMIFLTKNWTWSNLRIHYWKSGETDVTENLLYYGINQNREEIYYWEIPEDVDGFQFIGSEDYQDKYTKDITLADNNAWYFADWDSGANKANVATYTMYKVTVSQPTGGTVTAKFGTNGYSSTSELWAAQNNEVYLSYVPSDSCYANYQYTGVTTNGGQNGTYFTMGTSAVTVSATVTANHNWDTVQYTDWQLNNDVATCTASRECTVCHTTETEQVTGNRVGNVTEANCTTAGSVTYRAGASSFETPSQYDYTDRVMHTFTLPIDPDAHNWYVDHWTWTGYTAASAVFVCSNNSSHTQTVAATVTDGDGSAPTCTMGGHLYHNATVTFNGREYSDYQLETFAPLGHNMTAHAAVAATCTTAGNSVYWSCDSCGKFFADANGTTEIAADSWVIPATGHTLTAHTANAATCTTAGNSAYWSCDSCGKFFADANGTTEIAENSWVIAATGHNMTEHAAVPAGCTEAGACGADVLCARLHGIQSAGQRRDPVHLHGCAFRLL